MAYCRIPEAMKFPGNVMATKPGGGGVMLIVAVENHMLWGKRHYGFPGGGTQCAKQQVHHQIGRH